MKRLFVDTNIFLRFLTRDEPRKAEKILRLFKSAREGKVKLLTSDLVIAEVVWVLTSRQLYNFSKENTIESFLPLILEGYIELPSKPLILRTFDLFAEKNIDFADCYNSVLAESLGADFILSYDRDFDKIDLIKRMEP